MTSELRCAPPCSNRAQCKQSERVTEAALQAECWMGEWCYHGLWIGLVAWVLSFEQHADEPPCFVWRSAQLVAAVAACQAAQVALIEAGCLIPLLQAAQVIPSKLPNESSCASPS